jgi:hypothetical protein
VFSWRVGGAGLEDGPRLGETVDLFNRWRLSRYRQRLGDNLFNYRAMELRKAFLAAEVEIVQLIWSRPS